MLSSKLKKTLPFVLLCLFAYFSYLIMQSSPDASQGRKQAKRVLEVETLTVYPSDIQVTLESFGTVQASTTSNLYSQVTGLVTLVSESFKSGGSFKKGEVLLEIDPVDYEVALQVARSDLADAELALAEEQARYNQTQRDWKKEKLKKYVPESEFALREPQLRAATVHLETAKARLRLAEVNLQRTQVKAPYDGRITETFVNVGALVGPSTQLASLYESHLAEVRLPINLKDLSFISLPEIDQRIRENKSKKVVEISSPISRSNVIRVAYIDRAEATIDPATQQLYVVAVIEEPFERKLDESGKVVLSSLQLGQYVNAKIPGVNLSDVLTLPNDAIYQGSYVYVVEEGLLKRKDVNIGWRDDQFSVINDGLDDGDVVVTTVLGQVTSGAPVKVFNQSDSVELTEVVE